MRTFLQFIASIAVCLTLVGGAPVGVATAVAAEAPLLLDELPHPLVDALPSDLTFWVGTTENRLVSLGVVKGSGGRGAAFLCDGYGIWGWFTGKIRGRRFVDSGSRGSVRASLGKNGTATVDVNGTPLAFVLQRARDGAGVFRDTSIVDGDPVVSGWIITNDGILRGTLTTKTATTSVTVDVSATVKGALGSIRATSLTDQQFQAAVNTVLASVPEFDTSNVTLFSFGLSTRCSILKRGFIAAGEIYVESENENIQNVAFGVKGALIGRYQSLGCSSAAA